MAPPPADKLTREALIRLIGTRVNVHTPTRSWINRFLVDVGEVYAWLAPDGERILLKSIERVEWKDCVTRRLERL